MQCMNIIKLLQLFRFFVLLIFLTEFEISCRPPDHVSHGQYMPQKPTYLLNAQVHLVCVPGYFLWGDASPQCSSKNGGSWIHQQPCSLGDSCDPECLPPAVYAERCEKKSGHHATFRGQIALCLPSSGK